MLTLIMKDIFIYFSPPQFTFNREINIEHKQIPSTSKYRKVTFSFFALDWAKLAHLCM